MLKCPHFAEDIICILALNLQHVQEHTHTHLAIWQSDPAGHVPGEREHKGHEVGDKRFVSSSLFLTQNIHLKQKTHKGKHTHTHSHIRTHIHTHKCMNSGALENDLADLWLKLISGHYNCFQR